MISKKRIRIDKITKISFGVIMALSITYNGASAEKIYKTIKYFTVSGTTSNELDMSLANNGPSLDGSTIRHPGATILSFEPHITVYETPISCAIHSVSVDVHAEMHLPLWKERKQTNSKQLAFIWDSLSQDIKRHEEYHILIARSYASKIEKTIRNLKQEKNCTPLEKKIKKVTYAILEQHHNAQKKFDALETKNFDKRFISLFSAPSNNVDYNKRNNKLASY